MEAEQSGLLMVIAARRMVCFEMKVSSFYPICVHGCTMAQVVTASAAAERVRS